jgi:hypothetical protein
VAIPTKREDLVALGYEFTGEGKCRSCGQYSVIDVKDESKTFPQPILRVDRICHFVDCPNAADFRRPK